jgi:hypothetical protein
VGLQAADGAVIAYTDADCYADPSWLTHLVYQLQRSGAAAVGGPNLTPEDGWLAACVAAAPGQPMHVLESDQVAEHIPGCNMAFRRGALLAINGFDPQYRKAGDDVDVCWRLQQAGQWITFAPAAFVWHHRRQNPRAYLRQQAGYGEAEALLRFKHPDKFNGRGGGKWRGVLYGASVRGLSLSGPIIYRGTFGAGLFQCLYQPGPAHWAMLPGTLEWHLVVALLGLAAFFWPVLWLAVAALLSLSVAVAAIQAAQAVLSEAHDSLSSRLLLTALCYAQPLVRSWHRYRTRFLAQGPPMASLPFSNGGRERIPLAGTRTVSYWSEEGIERTELVGLFIAYLLEHRLGTTVDSGWSSWDMETRCHPWTWVRVCTTQEDHGGAKRLIRVRYRLGLTRFALVMAALVLAAAGVVASYEAAAGAIGAGVLGALLLGAWWRGTRLAGRIIGGFDGLARGLNMVRCEPGSREH